MTYNKEKEYKTKTGEEKSFLFCFVFFLNFQD